MTDRTDLDEWVLDAVRETGGVATVLEVAKAIWAARENDLRNSGDLFYTWQYDMRWAADRLRKAGRLKLLERKWALA
jgi:hypothetical protein